MRTKNQDYWEQRELWRLISAGDIWEPKTGIFALIKAILREVSNRAKDCDLDLMALIKPEVRVLYDEISNLNGAVQIISTQYKELSFSGYHEEAKDTEMIMKMFIRGEATQIRSVHAEFKLLKNYKKIRKQTKPKSVEHFMTKGSTFGAKKSSLDDMMS